MAEDDLLTVDLSAMTVEDYAVLRAALEDDDYTTTAALLDRYTVGGLLQRHWLCWYSAIEQAAVQIDEGQNAIQQAQAAVEWCNVVSKPIGAARAPHNGYE